MCSTNGGWRPFPGSPSSPSAWASTCWATACATCSIPRAFDPGPMNETPILAVEDLVVRYRGRHRETTALNGISFTLGRERLGIVGESGSGKTTVGRALLRLLPPG